jgi:hypothetical protein
MEADGRPALRRNATRSVLWWSLPLALVALGFTDSRTTVWVNGELSGQYFGWPFVWREYSMCCSLEYGIALGAWLADLLFFLVPVHIAILSLKVRWRVPRLLRWAMWLPLALLATGTLLQLVSLLSTSYDVTFWTLDDHQNAVRQREWTSRLN